MGENQNTYSRANYFNIPLNLIDLIFLLSFFHLILFKKSCLYDYVNKVLQNVLSLRIHLTIIALFFISLISLIINHELFTSLQLQIQILHLFRIIEIFLILLIFKIFFQNVNLEKFMKFLLLLSFIFSLIGVIHFLNIFNLKEVIDNRVTFCGILILNITFLPNFLFSKNLKFVNAIFWKLILYSMIFMSVLSCFISGKRTITVIIIIFLPLLLIYVSYYLKKHLKKNYLYIILAFIIPFFIGIYLQSVNGSNENYINKFLQKDHSLLDKTFGDKHKITSLERMPSYDTLITYNICLLLDKKNKDAKTKLINDIQDINNLNRLNHDQIITLKKIDLKTFSYLSKNCVLYNFDGSTIVRINKYVKSILLTLNKPFFGHGFWGTQYHYNFLPDSGLQIVLEIGYLGLFTIILSLFYLFMMLKIDKKHDYSEIFLFIITVFFIFLLSIFSNVFYEWRFLLILFIYWKFIFLKYNKKNNGI